MKNKLLMLLIVFSALLSCGKQQPWDSNTENSEDSANNSSRAENSEDSANNSSQAGNSEDSANNSSQAGNSEDSANDSLQAGNSEDSANDSPQIEQKKVSFTEVKPLFEKHCMICHGAVDPKINWLDQKTAKEYVENGKLYHRIWEKKADPMKGMPLGNAFGMTEDERQQIVDWIEGESV